MKIEFGDWYFDTISDAIRYSQDIIRFHNVGDVLKEDEHNFFVEAMKKFKDIDVSDANLVVIEVSGNAWKKHKSIQARWSDHFVDIPHTGMFKNITGKAINGKYSRKLKEACRVAAKEYHHEDFVIGYEIHHEGIPFDNIVIGFKSMYHLPDNYDDFKSTSGSDFERGSITFADERMKQNFLKFYDGLISEGYVDIEFLTTTDHDERHGVVCNGN